MPKPLTEVMASLHHEAKVRRVRERTGDELASWDQLSPDAQAAALSDMAEVSRFFRLFGLECRMDENGKGMLARIERKPEEVKEREPDPSNVVRLPPSPPPMVENKPMFTGRPCENCGSMNTIQNGKCLLCMECKVTGECG